MGFLSFFLFLFWKQTIQNVTFPNSLRVSLVHTPTPPKSLSQLTLLPMHTQHSLQRPLEFHPRLSGKSMHHFLLLLGEGVHGAGGQCRLLVGECTLSLTGGGISHKQLIIHDA